jgi:hypothetical protein
MIGANLNGLNYRRVDVVVGWMVDLPEAQSRRLQVLGKNFKVQNERDYIMEKIFSA